MLEDLLKAIKELTLALRENTAAQGTKPAKTAKVKPEAETLPAEAPVEKTPEKVVEKPTEKSEEKPSLTVPELTAIAQGVLDAGATRAFAEGDSALNRMKAINAKFGFRPSTSADQPLEKRQEYVEALKAAKAEIEKLPEAV